jgi:hypothetical protein
MAAVLGIDAAAVIPHPYRIRPDLEAQVTACAREEGKNRYQWALEQSNWADLVYFSPHLHIIAYGPLMDAAQFHHKTTWTYRNHDDRTNQGRHGEELRKTLYYLLSHAWVNGNHKIVRYWLGMSTHQLKRVDEGYTRIPVLCPSCGEVCVETPPDIVDSQGTAHHFYQLLANAPQATRKVLRFHFEPRVKTSKYYQDLI